MNIVYVVVIFGGQAIMRDKEPFDLKWPLAFWNLLLSVFSWIGAFRVVPHFFILLYYNGWHGMCCGHAETQYGAGALQLWIQLFIISKVFELLDTVFIVLRKKPLIFLHWYHHVTVFLFSWFAYCSESPAIVFVAMNYSVHAVMYGYYFLMAIKSIPKWFNPMFITLAQIAQMIVGCFTAASAYIYLKQAAANGTECGFKFSLLVAGGIMYSSYFYLFAEFAVKRFIFKKPSSGSKKVKTN